MLKISLNENLTISSITDVYAGFKESLQAEKETVELDLSAIETIDSAGLQLIMFIKQTCQNRNIPLNCSFKNKVVLDAAEHLGIVLN